MPNFENYNVTSVIVTTESSH